MHETAGTPDFATEAGPRRRFSFPPRRGFSLPEVMLALVIIGTTCLSALAGLLFSYRNADSNLRAQQALANARAVAEQVLTLDLGTLADATIPVDVPGSSVGTLTVDAWNPRVADIHDTPSDPGDDFAIAVRPEVMQSDESSGFRCAQVIIHYRWSENSFFGARTREEALTVLVSDVSAD